MRKRKCASKYMGASILTLAILTILATTHPHAQNAETNPFTNANAILKTSNGTQHQIRIEVAATPLARSQGLMFRETIPPDGGMLLVWPQPQIVGIWMDNTPLPLDLLFINAEGRIVQLHQNAKPFDRTIIPSKQEILMVLELPAGQISQLQLREGDRLQLLP